MLLAASKSMYALPPRLDADIAHVTGISCPECGGVLAVRIEGRDATLVFECRIGHTLDVPELLAAKEERLEDLLWSANTLLHELVALLQDLAAHGTEHGESADSIRAYGERATRARANSGALRGVISACRPIDLAPAEPGTDGAGGPPHPEGFVPPGPAGR
jgi:hypothetical protein